MSCDQTNLEQERRTEQRRGVEQFLLLPPHVIEVLVQGAKNFGAWGIVARHDNWVIGLQKGGKAPLEYTADSLH